MNCSSSVGVWLCGALCALFASLFAQPGSAAALPHYQIDVDVDFARGTFAGELAVVYVNPSTAPISEALFRLYANARTLYGSASIAVHEARVNGNPAATHMSAEDTVLAVRLPQSLAPTEAAQIVLTFSGAAARSVGGTYLSDTEYGLLLKAEHGLTLTTFYPVLAPLTARGWAIDPVATVGDAMFADTARYDVTLRVASGVAVIPSPDVSEAHADGTTTHVFHRAALRDFSLVLLAASRSCLEATASAVSVRSWFTPQHAEAAAVALGLGAAAIDAFTSLFGALPLPSVDIVEVPLQRVAGVELAGLILVSADYSALPQDPFFSVIVSHEVAHEWFYATVGSDPLWEPWLDEALATYASYLFLSSAAPDIAQSQKPAWASLYDPAQRNAPDLHVTSPSSDFSDSATYSAFVYSGGAHELDFVRSALGDGPFFEAMASYYSNHALGIATGTDLLIALRNACGCAVPGTLFPAQAPL